MAVEETAAAIVLAAGESRRMGQDKIVLSIAGRPLLAYALDAFESCAEVDQVVVVLSPDNAPDILPLLGEYPKVVRTCMGGRRRQDSVRAIEDCAGPQQCAAPQHGGLRAEHEARSGRNADQHG